MNPLIVCIDKGGSIVANIIQQVNPYSKDSISVCSHCRMSPYDEYFDEFHDEFAGVSAKICQCCGGTGWEGSECSDLRAKLLELQRENDLLREFIAALPEPPASRHFEEFQPSPEMMAAWEGVDADKWLEELRGTEVDL